jgi:hypothetical protein
MWPVRSAESFSVSRPTLVRAVLFFQTFQDCENRYFSMFVLRAAAVLYLLWRNERDIEISFCRSSYNTHNTGHLVWSVLVLG